MTMQTTKKLVPANPKHCQCWKYEPFTMGGDVHHQCGNKPSWILRETKKGKDGLKGEMSVCDACRKEWAKNTGNQNIDDSWKWEAICRKKKQ